MTTDPSELLKAYHLGKKINNIFQKCNIKDDKLYMNTQQENEMTVLLTLRSKIGGKVEA